MPPNPDDAQWVFIPSLPLPCHAMPCPAMPSLRSPPWASSPAAPGPSVPACPCLSLRPHACQPVPAPAVGRLIRRSTMHPDWGASHVCVCVCLGCVWPRYIHGQHHHTPPRQAPNMSLTGLKPGESIRLLSLFLVTAASHGRPRREAMHVISVGSPFCPVCPFFSTTSLFLLQSQVFNVRDRDTTYEVHTPYIELVQRKLDNHKSLAIRADTQRQSVLGDRGRGRGRPQDLASTGGRQAGARLVGWQAACKCDFCWAYEYFVPVACCLHE